MNPMNHYLGDALARMEGTEAAQITSSGMAAISCTLLQICSAGDEIISSRTIYGGTYALMKEFLPKFNINTNFVNITDLKAIKKLINKNTKVIYCETISNPLLEVADLAEISKLCKKNGIKLVVDNTFSPQMISPLKFGADVVVYSITKFINGSSDCVAGAICASHDFIASLKDVHSGATMLLGPTMDSLRSSSILKNLHTLHIRMKQHSKNAQFIAEKLEKAGLRVFYPGLKSHPQHELIKTMMNPEYGFGGMITFDAKDAETANRLMMDMQESLVGYFAVSLGFYKTLFSSPGSSTSSEIPPEEQVKMGLSPGLVRMSIGIDDDIAASWKRIQECLKKEKLV
jgi:methionine-gamma-lyase